MQLVWNQTVASYVENYANIRVVDYELNHSMNHMVRIFLKNEMNLQDQMFGRSNFMTMMMELLGFGI